MNRTIPGLLLLTVLTPAAPAAEVVHPIRDGAGLFSPEAIASATDQILEMRQTVSIAFVIETTATLPEEALARLQRSSNVDRTFGEIALERARAEDIRGIFVYVCKIKDAHLQTVAVVVWPEEYRQSFTDNDRERLRKLLASKLEKQPDEVLLKAVSLVRTRLKKKLAADSSWLGWGTLAAILGGLVALWLVLGLMHMWLARPTTSGTEGAPAPRAGFVPGLLGGMFGSMAGHWIYDTLIEMPPTPPPDAAARERRQ